MVTGGAGLASGLGAGLVRRFAAEGMSVAILDRDGEGAERLAAQLREEGIDAIGLFADVTDPASLASAAERVRAEFGACNVLCAHVGGGGQGRFDEIEADAWRSALESMVLGTVATINAFLPLIRQTFGPRRIVLTASAAALAPGRFQGPYRAAKAAVTSIGETLALELASEGIGTTIAFPSGMLGPDLIPQVIAAIGFMPQDSDDPAIAIGAEMVQDPDDVATGFDAAGPIVDAVKADRPYVVTHGVTVERNARARQALLDEAFAENAERRAARAAG